jgi:hypothetical protein
MSRTVLACLVVPFVAAAALARAEVPSPWQPAAEESVVELVTQDEDGSARETSVWIVVLDDAGYVRTNASRWLANIQRGSPVTLRVRDLATHVQPEEVGDEATKARVEEAFKEKYGTMQRIMSAIRLREPTVLRLRPAP